MQIQMRAKLVCRCIQTVAESHEDKTNLKAKTISVKAAPRRHSVKFGFQAACSKEIDLDVEQSYR